MQSKLEGLISTLHYENPSETEVETLIWGICMCILQRAILVIGGKDHIVCEVEAYVNSPRHPDTFTHSSEDQGRTFCWYFHKHGKSYRGGTHKGVDIAIGNETIKAGILIRMIYSLEDNKVFEGPCVVVNHILNTTNFKSISDLVSSEKYSENIWNYQSLLHIRDSSLVAEDYKDMTPVIQAPRVGLTPRNQDHLKWVAKQYRFARVNHVPAKLRVGFAISLIMIQNLTAKQVASKLGIPTAKVLKWSEIASKSKTGGGDLQWLIGSDVRNTEIICRMIAETSF